MLGVAAVTEGGERDVTLLECQGDGRHGRVAGRPRQVQGSGGYGRRHPDGRKGDVRRDRVGRGEAREESGQNMGADGRTGIRGREETKLTLGPVPQGWGAAVG